MPMSLKRLSAVLAAAASFAAALPAGAGTVVEYYHKDLDHYFVTGLAAEVRDLDSGKFTGWARTGFSFETYGAGDAGLANSVPVCRFYGNPAKGLDSHFYSASVAECEAVKQKWPDFWLLETMDLFRAHAVNPQTGQCPSGTKAVYRLYNKRADVNHRYTTDAATVDAMIAKGYVLEGDGDPKRPVAFCAANVAPAQPAAGAPACVISSGAAFAVLGTPVTLTATCTNTPTTFAWSNCIGSGSTCSANASAAGKVSYSLVATNAVGPSAPASITLDWQAASSAAPMCTVSSSAANVLIGSSLTLTANCSQQPSQFQWMSCSALLTEACNLLSECSATSSTCRPVGTQAGPVFYALIAKNNAGSSPKAGVQVEWTSSSVAPPPPTSPTSSCTITPSSTSPSVGNTLTLTASCNNAPTSYAWTGCSSSTSTCTTTESAAITRNYTVTATNAAGIGFPAQVSVTWQQPPTAPPVCTVTANPANPYVGGNITLTASCTQAPTAFQWTNCTSTGASCTTSSAQSGSVTYSVVGSNQFGPGSAASTTVNWATTPPPGSDLCSAFPSIQRADLLWDGAYATRVGQPRIGPGTLFVGRMVVPANAASPRDAAGLIAASEFDGSPANRIMTLSTQPCDFRGYVPTFPTQFPRGDATGANGPLAWGGGGISATIAFLLAGDAAGSPPKPLLNPGQVYYVNIRSVNPWDLTDSCTSGYCDMRINLSAPN